jgi:5-methylcytosine-specific restriction endonuclease McrA
MKRNKRPYSAEDAAYHHEYYLRHAKRYKQYRAENRERRREVDLRWRYGIGPEQYTLLLQAQGNACAICKRPFGIGKKHGPHIDHLHEMEGPRSSRIGQIRGLLCKDCNVGIGNFMENPAFLEAAIAYLAAPPAYDLIEPKPQLKLFEEPA